jgi:hypothetical protein
LEPLPNFHQIEGDLKENIVVSSICDRVESFDF